MDRHHRPQPGLVRRPPPARASEHRRDLGLLIGAVAICTVAGTVAVTALVAGVEASWWAVAGLVAVLAIGGCLTTIRQQHTLDLPTPGGVGHTGANDRPSDVT